MTLLERMWLDTIIRVLLKSSAALNTPVDGAGAILCFYSLLPWDRKQCIYLFSSEVLSLNKWIKSASLKWLDYKSSHLLYLLQKEKQSWRNILQTFDHEFHEGEMWYAHLQPIARSPPPPSRNRPAFIWSLWTAERWVLRRHWWTEYSYWGKVKEH